MSSIASLLKLGKKSVGQNTMILGSFVGGQCFNSFLELSVVTAHASPNQIQY